MVFVLNKKKNPLTTCHPSKARKLFKSEKTTIHKKCPFNIRLKKLKLDDVKDVFRLKLGYESRYTGLIILKNNRDIIWLAQIHHRNDVKKNTGALTKKAKSADRPSLRCTLCAGQSTSDELRFKTNGVLYIYSKGRGGYKRCKLGKYGFRENLYSVSNTFTY